MPATEFFWNQLLDFVDEGHVVPVVGQDLLRVAGDGEPRLLYTYLAKRLAKQLGLPAATAASLNRVACSYLGKSGIRRDDIYSALRQIMPGREELAVPVPLAKLAEIRPLRLFVSTTFDPLLRRALDAARSETTTRVLAYSPERPEDLPRAWKPSASPTVFHLLGRLSTEPSYAVTEEDVLEFVHALQSESRRPERLLDQLHRAHLLILGSGFEDWLTRFFLRTTVRARLSVAPGIDYLADSAVLEDPKLLGFLRAFSSRTRVFEDGGAVEFVDELHRRWRVRHPQGAPEPQPPIELASSELPPGTVFLSYASEDLAVAQSLRSALDKAGIEVWFDKRHLEWGDRWEEKLKRCIEQSSFFLPLISRNTLTEERRYFRMEWDLAAVESRKAKSSTRFLLPVYIDDTPLDHRDIPAEFRRTQQRVLKGDSAEIAEDVRTLVRERQRQLRSSSG